MLRKFPPQSRVSQPNKETPSLQHKSKTQLSSGFTLVDADRFQKCGFIHSAPTPWVAWGIYIQYSLNQHLSDAHYWFSAASLA